jgi:hypothetical protein
MYDVAILVAAEEFPAANEQTEVVTSPVMLRTIGSSQSGQNPLQQGKERIPAVLIGIARADK